MSALLGNASGVPIGTIAAHPANIPGGWLECDGSAISRTDYAGLFAEIGTTYGAGDGATTFNLPDLRGEFVRGLDNGRGVDSARALASAQLDQMQQITGGLDIGRGYLLNKSGAFNASESVSVDRAGGSTAITNLHPRFDSAQSPGARAGEETRPRNVAMYYAIKY